MHGQSSNTPSTPASGGTLFNTGNKPAASPTTGAGKSSGTAWAISGILGFLVLVLLGFSIFFFVRLNSDQDKILALKNDQDASENRIGQLEVQLYQMENKLTRKIDSTSQEFANMTQQQTEEVKKLKGDVGKKADRSDVASVSKKAETIASSVGTLNQNLQDVDQNVKKVDTKVTEVDSKVQDQAKLIEEQRKLIEQNTHNINATQDLLNATRDVLMNVKLSVERDYYVFQLEKKSGIVRIKDVGLRLDKTNKKKQKCNIFVIYDDKNLTKKDLDANTPVKFYKMDYKRDYEVVITTVVDDKVAGYLSIPKTKS